jgi:DNA-binding transcriptional regulator YdaS (Cro superfamily)
MKSKAEIKQQQSDELNRLLEWIGTKVKLANECYVSAQSVNGWFKRGRISRNAATIVHRKSDGLFKREDLRPDVITWNESI